jgi:hypothetical protein
LLTVQGLDDGRSIVLAGDRGVGLSTTLIKKPFCLFHLTFSENTTTILKHCEIDPIITKKPLIHVSLLHIQPFIYRSCCLALVDVNAVLVTVNTFVTIFRFPECYAIVRERLATVANPFLPKNLVFTYLHVSLHLLESLWCCCWSRSSRYLEYWVGYRQSKQRGGFCLVGRLGFTACFRRACFHLVVVSLELCRDCSELCVLILMVFYVLPRYEDPTCASRGKISSR